jgi:hypothetical protein
MMQFIIHPACPRNSIVPLLGICTRKSVKSGENIAAVLIAYLIPPASFECRRFSTLSQRLELGGHLPLELGRRARGSHCGPAGSIYLAHQATVHLLSEAVTPLRVAGNCEKARCR